MEFGEKIKLGLECCRNVWVDDHWKNCDGACPYQAEQSYCKNVLHHDTLAYIRQLEEELEQVKRERDALKTDMLLAEADNNFCQICAHLGCNDKTVCVDRTEYDCFEWRGVPKE